MLGISVSITISITSISIASLSIPIIFCAFCACGMSTCCINQNGAKRWRCHGAKMKNIKIWFPSLIECQNCWLIIKRKRISITLSVSFLCKISILHIYSKEHYTSRHMFVSFLSENVLTAFKNHSGGNCTALSHSHTHTHWFLLSCFVLALPLSFLSSTISLALNSPSSFVSLLSCSPPLSLLLFHFLLALLLIYDWWPCSYAHVVLRQKKKWGSISSEGPEVTITQTHTHYWRAATIGNRYGAHTHPAAAVQTHTEVNTPCYC